MIRNDKKAFHKGRACQRRPSSRIAVSAAVGLTLPGDAPRTATALRVKSRQPETPRRYYRRGNPWTCGAIVIRHNNETEHHQRGPYRLNFLSNRK